MACRRAPLASVLASRFFRAGDFRVSATRTRATPLTLAADFFAGLAGELPAAWQALSTALPEAGGRDLLAALATRLSEPVPAIAEAAALAALGPGARIVTPRTVSQDGMATDWHLMHYGNLAQSGAGLLILEASAVEARTPVIVLLWNNQGYEEIKKYMVNRAIEPVGVDIHTPDFIGVARALGAAAEGAVAAGVTAPGWAACRRCTSSRRAKYCCSTLRTKSTVS